MFLRTLLAAKLIKYAPTELVKLEYTKRGIEVFYKGVVDTMLDTYFKETDGFMTIGEQPNVMNVLTPMMKNICIWYDGTPRPAKAHNGLCEWKFDGQIWRHL